MLTVAALLLTGVMARAETIYVRPDGDDSRDGKTLATALKTPQKAHDRANPGDTVLFAAGEYTATGGQAVLSVTRSGTPGKPITFAAQPGARVVFHNKGAWNGIRVLSAHHIVLRGFEVDGIAPEITEAEARREMNNLGNPRTCGNGIGIDADKSTKEPSTHITVRDCVVHDLPGGGIFANHSDYVTFENNVVYRCALWAPYACSGISVYQPTNSDDSTDTKIIIRNNLSYENENRIPFYYSNAQEPEKRQITDGNGIIVDDYANSQEFGKGAGRPYLGRTLIANNVVLRNGGSGIHAYLSTNVDIVHNWAEGNNTTPDKKGGQIFSNAGKNVRVWNNVLIAPAGKPVNSDYNNGAGVDYDYNLYAAQGGAEPAYTRPKAHNRVVAGPPGVTLEGWEAGGARRVRVLRAADSPLRGGGTPFAAADRGFFGERRPSPPDIGPFVLASAAREARR
jgi:hypothetical protein